MLPSKYDLTFLIRQSDHMKPSMMMMMMMMMKEADRILAD